MVGATQSEGKVSSVGEGKIYLQPDDITEVTAESSVASTRASTRAAILKAANQAVQDSYLQSFSRNGKFSGPDCDGAVNSFPLAWLKPASPIATTLASLRMVLIKHQSMTCASAPFLVFLISPMLPLSTGALLQGLISTNLHWICSIHQLQPGAKALMPSVHGGVSVLSPKPGQTNLKPSTPTII